MQISFFRRAKFLILISILLIGGFVLINLWINIKDRKVSEEAKAPPSIPTGNADVHMEKIRFVEDKHGQRTWELEANSIQQYQDKNVLVLEDVKLTFFEKEGRTFVLTGKKGKVYQDSKNVELAGDIVLTSSDGYRLKTQSISYDHAQKKATSPDPLEIEGDQMRIEGRGLSIDMENRVFKILDQVKTRWKGGKG